MGLTLYVGSKKLGRRKLGKMLSYTGDANVDRV